MIAFIKKRQGIVIILISLVVVCTFFYKTVFHHQIPFPGDLLINENPYKTESFLGYPAGGYPNLAQGRDVIAELYPWKYFTIQELKKGHIPFWNPYNFSGNVHMQNYQSAVFSPFNIFFFLFPFTTGWTISIIMQPFLAILFMYIFLRSLKLGSVASLFGGISFGFSSYMTVWMEYGNIGATLVWLPLVLFGINKYIEKLRINYFLLTIIAFTCSFFSGYIQGTFYTYLVAFLFSFYQVLPKRKTLSLSEILGLVFIFLLPICLAAFQLLPTYTVLGMSARNPYSLQQIENILQPLYYWVTIFIPDFFGNPAHRNYFLQKTYIEQVMFFGIPLIFFSIFSMVKVKKREMKFFLMSALGVLIFTTNFPLIKYLYQLPIPMISTTVPTRFFSIFITCMIIVGAFGIDFWYKQKKFEKTVVPFIFLGIYGLIWISVLLFPQIFPEVISHKETTIHNLFFPTIIALLTVICFYGRYIKKLYLISALFLLCVLVVDLFFFFQKITPFSPIPFNYPQTPVISYLQQHAGINRFWGYGSAYIPPNIQTYDHTYSPEGYDPLYLQTYGILLKSSIDGKYPRTLPRPDANVASGYGSEDIKNSSRQKILNLLGVKYILSQWNNFPQDKYQLIWEHLPWQVYENKNVLPRFFLTSQYTLINNNKTGLDKLYTINLSKTVLLSTKPEYPLSNNAKGVLSLIEYSPEQVRFKTNTTGNMLLFLSDNYYPEWQAKVDQTIVPLHKSDLTFRAIEVPKGNHTVTFFYNPRDFLTGLKIALAGLIICIIYSVYFYRYVQKR